MELPPQPPPDLPPPPPDKAALRSRKWMNGIVMAGLLSLAGVLLLGLPLRPVNRSADATMATGNARQLATLLLEFEMDYGAFPNESIRLANLGDFPDSRPATDANSCLGLLISGGYTQSEEFFYARNPRLPLKRPDNWITTSHLLEPGECGFSYVQGLSTKSDFDTPILLAPMIPGTLTFDRKAYKGRAVILFVDGRVEQLKIDRSGRAIFRGKDLFDLSQPFWHGKKPDLRHPAR